MESLGQQGDGGGVQTSLDKEPRATFGSDKAHRLAVCLSPPVLPSHPHTPTHRRAQSVRDHSSDLPQSLQGHRCNSSNQQLSGGRMSGLTPVPHLTSFRSGLLDTGRAKGNDGEASTLHSGKASESGDQNKHSFDTCGSSL